MPLTVDFYYGLGSRYSYLATTQLARIAAEADLIGFADDAGLDAQAFRAQLDDPATAAQYQAALQAAHQRGAFGVPTFFLGERLFWGNDRLVLLEHFIEKARAGAGA